MFIPILTLLRHGGYSVFAGVGKGPQQLLVTLGSDEITGMVMTVMIMINSSMSSLVLHCLAHCMTCISLKLPGERTREGNDLYHEMMASGVIKHPGVKKLRDDLIR